MSHPVNVTRYRAMDGTLHDSERAAELHDEFMRKWAIEEAVCQIVSEETWHGDLSEWCGYHHTQQTRIYDENAYERRQRHGVIASIIINRWDDLKVILDRPE